MLARPRTSACWVAVAAGVCLTLSGCGGTTKARGKVTSQGKPVVWGSVTLVDTTGAFHQGNIDLNGDYEIANVPAGPVKIAVVSPNPEASRGRGGAGRPGPKAKGGVEDPRDKAVAESGGKSEDTRPRPPAGAWFPLDLKFADPATSGLTGEVKSGTELNIDIK